MPGLRDEISKTFRRLSRRAASRTPSDTSLDETVVASDSRQGKQFGSYRVLRRLGHGGMGHVYLALDTRLGRHAALKFLSPRLAADEMMLQRLQREARTASGLNHPNILTIYDIAEADGEHFIASEFVEGTTLRSALERKLIEAEAAIDVVMQTAAALVAAHSAGVIHRDVKPSNIMIRPDGLVKVIDFGLAKLTAVNPFAPRYEPLSNPAAIAGTMEYMSPEQARGENVDHRTDLWSLGVVLYEALSEKLPFDGETESHVIVAILDHPPLAFSPVRPVPQGITKILERALVKDRNKRYQTAREMLDDLQALDGGSDRTSNRQRLQIAPEAKRAHGRQVAASAVALAVTGLAIWWFPFHGKEKILGPDWFEPGPAEQVTHAGNVGLAAISPDGHYLAYTIPKADQETLHIRNLLTGSDQQLSSYADSTLGLTFSPDSRSLYYVVHDQREWGRLYSVDVSPLGIARLVLEDIDGPVTFSPDGKRFAFLRMSDQNHTRYESIMVAQSGDTGDQKAIVTKVNTQIGRKLAWSPDGHVIAAIVLTERLNASVRPDVVLFSLSGAAEARYMGQELREMSGPVWLAPGLLAFSGLKQGEMGEQAHLQEFSVYTGVFQDMASRRLTENSMSITRDGNKLAAVSTNPRSSLWIADATRLDKAVSLTAANDKFDSLAWIGDNQLIIPSSRGGSVNLWQIDAAGKARRLAQSEMCVERQPAVVPKRSVVIYSSNCAAGGDDFNLWRLDADSGQRRQLTSGSNYDQLPDITGDGKWIVYTSWPHNVSSVWKIPVDGGNAVQISNLDVRDAVVSKDCRFIACRVQERPDSPWRVVLLSTLDGSIQMELPAIPAQPGSPLHWSPDGRWIDFLDGQSGTVNIWRLRLGGKQPEQVTHLAGEDIYNFAWSESGTKLAYIRGKTESDVILLHRARRD